MPRLAAGEAGYYSRSTRAKPKVSTSSSLRTERTPERQFERDWALALLDRVVVMIRREYEASGRGAIFDVLKVVLEAGSCELSQADIASRLGTTEAAAQVAVHRLRKRYRVALRAAIAATVDDEAEVDDELHALFAALGP